MKKIDVKTIDEITEKVIDYRGKTPQKTDRGIKLITAKVIKDGYVVDGNHEYISEETYKDWMTRGFPQKNDVLITTEAPLGEVALLRTNEKIALAQRVILLRGKPNLIDQIYYMYALKTSFVQEQLKARSVSTTVAGIKQSDLLEVKIPYLPIDEQKRIAAIAQKCDRIRRVRRASQRVSDRYLQCVFSRMFGDIEINPLDWHFLTLEKIANIASGVTKGQNFNGRKTLSVPYLRVANVQDGYLDLSEIKHIQALPSEIEALKLQKGDVLMTEGGDFDKLGRGAIWDGQIETCIHQNHIFRVRTNQSIILPNFFASFLLTTFAKRYFLRCSKQTTNLATINMTQLKELPVPIVPLNLQKKFVQIAQIFERIRIQQQEADRQAEHLFQTVLDRAFKGEL
ncbi:restriction endonuclease subunit S [Leptolyngbya sp. AN03gr2]|uniref:restriction endonuclease subunit S n=1 Tax=unclassified Leptolyngbya TaxID=2650499 RepID=UPI003D31F996